MRGSAVLTTSSRSAPSPASRVVDELAKSRDHRACRSLRRLRGCISANPAHRPSLCASRPLSRGPLERSCRHRGVPIPRNKRAPHGLGRGTRRAIGVQDRRRDRRRDRQRARSACLLAGRSCCVEDEAPCLPLWGGQYHQWRVRSCERSPSHDRAAAAWGCWACIQSAICCALLAAVKMARLSERSTSSQEAI